MEKNFKPLNFVVSQIDDELHIIYTDKDIIKSNVQSKSILMAYNSNVMTKKDAVARAKKQIETQLKMELDLGVDAMPWAQQKIEEAGTTVGAYQTRHSRNGFKKFIVKILKSWVAKIEQSYKGWEEELNSLKQR